MIIKFGVSHNDEVVGNGSSWKTSTTAAIRLAFKARNKALKVTSENQLIIWGIVTYVVKKV